MINQISHKLYKLAAMVIGCFFVCTGCENDINVVKNLGVKVKGVDEANNVLSYMSQDGKTRAKLTAPLMLLSMDENGRKVEYPKTLRVDFFTDSLKLQSKLFARYGSYIERDSKIQYQRRHLDM
jgi:hypothetical protein